MINLHMKYNHYLHTDRTIDHDDINEKLISYGWTDDGNNVIGYYLITENHVLHFNLKEQLVSKEKTTERVA